MKGIYWEVADVVTAFDFRGKLVRFPLDKFKNIHRIVRCVIRPRIADLSATTT
jgi:hypothetical protein